MNTPVLFTIFNRIETAQKVFNQIRKAQPTKLYIAADGARAHKPGEKETVEQVRNTILSQIDWQCEVKTLLRDQNLGCKNALSSAITWFFENEEEGIILEDDCVPEQSFFSYCSKMLETYRNDTRVMVVSGTNYLHEQTHPTDSIFFIRYYAIWGWATWRRAWNLYDISMKQWPKLKENKLLYSYFNDVEVAHMFESLFDDVYYKNNDTWDIQWVYTCLFNNAVAVVPSKNQIANIQVDGTHQSVKPSPFVNMQTAPLSVSDITFPRWVFPDIQKEELLFKTIGAYQKFGKLKHIVRKLKQVLVTSHKGNKS